MPILLIAIWALAAVGFTVNAGNTYGPLGALSVVGFFWLVPLGGSFLLGEYYKRRGPRP